MARYDYMCRHCGVFEVTRPIDAPVGAQVCTTCGGTAMRVFSPPALTSPDSTLRRARDSAERSAHEPEVRTNLPARPRGTAHPPNPLHARLPRPWSDSQE